MGRLFRKITAEKGARSARKPRSLCAFHAYARSRREFERAMMAKRVRAGLARVRGEGKRLGRPPIAPTLEKRIREALAAPGRPGVRVIAKQFGVDPGTVQRISRPFAAASVAVG